MTGPLVVGLGEAMVLFQPAFGESLAACTTTSVHVAGAELNLLAAVRRAGVRAAFCSRVGSDPFGERVLAAAAGLGVETELVAVDPTRPTGVFAKEVREDGARRVYYYRAGSAASALDESDVLRALTAGPTVVAVSGLTAALGDAPRRAVTTLGRLIAESRTNPNTNGYTELHAAHANDDTPEHPTPHAAPTQNETPEHPAVSAAHTQHGASERPAVHAPHTQHGASERPAVHAPHTQHGASERPAVHAPHTQHDASEHPAVHVVHPHDDTPEHATPRTTRTQNTTPEHAAMRATHIQDDGFEHSTADVAHDPDDGERRAWAAAGLARGVHLALDPNLRPGLAPMTDLLRELLPVTSFLLLGIDEAGPLLGTEEPGEVFRRAAALGVGEVVLKAGADGCWYAGADGPEHLPSAAVHVVDPVGAGDAFAGAYLAARLRGIGPRGAAWLGTRFAAGVVAAPGDTDGLPDADEAAVLLEAARLQMPGGAPMKGQARRVHREPAP